MLPIFKRLQDIFMGPKTDDKADDKTDDEADDETDYESANNETGNEQPDTTKMLDSETEESAE